MTSFKNVSYIVWLAVLISIIAPLLVYGFAFHKNGVSTKTSSWAEFASYLSAFLALGNLIVFAILTLAVQKYNVNNDHDNSYIKDVLNRPILGFKIVAPNKYYTVENIGKGSAINVRIRGKFENDEWQENFIYYGIKDGSQIDMEWSSNCNKLAAVYLDIFGREFISFMDDDKLRIIDTCDRDSTKRYKAELDLYNSPSVDPTWI